MRTIQFVPAAFKEYQVIYKTTETSILIISCYSHY